MNIVKNFCSAFHKAVLIKQLVFRLTENQIAFMKKGDIVRDFSQIIRDYEMKLIKEVNLKIEFILI